MIVLFLNNKEDIEQNADEPGSGRNLLLSYRPALLGMLFFSRDRVGGIMNGVKFRQDNDNILTPPIIKHLNKSV